MPFDSGLAAMLAIKEKITMRAVYHPIINLVDISHSRVLDHFKDRETSLGELLRYIYLQNLIDPISKKYRLFNLTFCYS